MKLDATHEVFLLRVFLSLVMISTAAPSYLNAQTPAKGQESSEAHGTAFAGCYEVTLGRWWPWSYGEDTVYVTPPSQIEPLSVRGTEGFEKDSFLIRTVPAPKMVGSGWRISSFWQVESKNWLTLTWTNGFTAVSLKLEKQGDELRGWAHPHFDFPHLIPRTAHVTARKIPCPTSGGNPTIFH